jgi:hypothetical protein
LRWRKKTAHKGQHIYIDTTANLPSCAQQTQDTQNERHPALFAGAQLLFCPFEDGRAAQNPPGEVQHAQPTPWLARLNLS